MLCESRQNDEATFSGQIRLYRKFMSKKQYAFCTELKPQERMVTVSGRTNPVHPHEDEPCTSWAWLLRANTLHHYS